MTEPTLHDIARGTTGCGDDDADIAEANWNGPPFFPYDFDDEPFTIEVPDNPTTDDEFAALPVLNLDAWSDYLSRPHVHDAGCNGTLEHSEEILCGFPGSTGHIYCERVRPSLNGGCS